MIADTRRGSTTNAMPTGIAIRAQRPNAAESNDWGSVVAGVMKGLLLVAETETVSAVRASSGQTRADRITEPSTPRTK
jgi:hypothetical protein